MLVLIQWICMHLIGDFVLQTSKAVTEKKLRKEKSWRLYWHCLLHGILIYIITMQWHMWLVPCIVIITHFFIDLWKLYQNEKFRYFIIDQLLHLIVLFVLYIVFYQQASNFKHYFISFINNTQVWLVISGYIFIIFPLSFIIGFATEKWRKKIETPERQQLSLSDAGKWIGIFERIMVFTFVIINHFEGIGFLIAAKSILRFNDIKGNEYRKEAEYVLIGTLISFSTSIIIGLFINYLLLS